MVGVRIEGGIITPIQVIAATGTVKSGTQKVLLNNGATAITVKLPLLSEVEDGHSILFSRMPTSSGAVTINPNTGATTQALNGTAAGTTSIGAHSAAGAGLNLSFTKYGTVWYRM